MPAQTGASGPFQDSSGAAEREVTHSGAPLSRALKKKRPGAGPGRSISQGLIAEAVRHGTGRAVCSRATL
jgi:hypothetical protein